MNQKAIVIKGLLAASCGLSILGFTAIAQAATVVDTEISFLLDLSGSVDASEYALQVGGYVDAFNNLDFTGTNFAANFIVWSGATQQLESVTWTLINDNTSAASFADAIEAALLPPGGSRPFAGSTAPGSAINYAVPLFASNDFDAARQVIDVSGDGAENNGASTSAARDAALTAGIDQINGLPILGSEFGLEAWYNANIKGGAGAFVIPANTFDDFADAIEEKIEAEIIDPVTTPEPSSVVSLAGLGAVAAFSVLKRNSRQAK